MCGLNSLFRPPSPFRELSLSLIPQHATTLTRGRIGDEHLSTNFLSTQLAGFFPFRRKNKCLMCVCVLYTKTYFSFFLSSPLGTMTLAVRRAMLFLLCTFFLVVLVTRRKGNGRRPWIKWVPNRWCRFLRKYCLLPGENVFNANALRITIQARPIRLIRTPLTSLHSCPCRKPSTFLPTRKGLLALAYFTPNSFHSWRLAVTTRNRTVIQVRAGNTYLGPQILKVFHTISTKVIPYRRCVWYHIRK